MAFEKIKIRRYEGGSDKVGVEDLERRCEVGPSHHVFLFTDTMGDPICRIRNTPIYIMLVAELNKEIVGVIQGSIKVVTVLNDKLPPPNDVVISSSSGGGCRVGYVLGLRVAPLHRRKGIGLKLVLQLEEWFNANQVDYAYMATEKHNEASVSLFIHKLGYVKFRTPTILVHPAVRRRRHRHQWWSTGIEIVKLKVERAEFMYRNYMMNCTEFFPHDIDKILRNKLSLGTWMAYYSGETEFGSAGDDDGDGPPSNWAMVSVWNSGGAFKLRIGKAPLSCIIYSKSSRMIDRAFPCFRFTSLIPDFFNPFGFYFMYGLYRQGPSSGKLLRALCKFVHNLATQSQSRDCKAVVTEVGGDDSLKFHIPHWKLLSCPEDLWCIKPLTRQLNNNNNNNTNSTTTTPTTSFNFLLSNKNPSLFVDPREV